MKLNIFFMPTGYIKMELRDLVKRFEESEKLIWFCPIIKCSCAPDCYSYRPKTISFQYHLKEELTGRHHTSWSQDFKNIEEITVWKNNLTYKITIINFRILNEHCAIIDKFLKLGEENA